MSPVPHDAPAPPPSVEEELDARDAELVARAELSEGEGDPDASLDIAPSADSDGEPGTRDTTSPSLETPPTAPAAPLSAGDVASLRRAVKIVIRLGQANERNERAAHVFIQVDGADPVCALRVPPSPSALDKALPGLAPSVTQLLAQPPKASFVGRTPAATSKPTDPKPAQAPRVCTICNETFPKGGLKAHQKEARHREAELVAAARRAATPLTSVAEPAAPNPQATPRTQAREPSAEGPVQPSLFR